MNGHQFAQYLCFNSSASRDNQTNPLTNPTCAESTSSTVISINDSLAGAWMLDYLGETENSKAIFDATKR